MLSMAEKAWRVIEPQLNLKNLQSEDFNDFESAFRNGLSSYLCAFDLCGFSPECSDEIEGAPMVDHDDHIYHLVLPGPFTELVSGLSFSVFHSIKHLAKPGDEGFILAALESTLRHELAQSLYYNPVCGRIDLCNESRPLDPWFDR